MTNETKVVEQRIVQRLIKTIADYEVGGNLYSQVIPLHTQAYAIYDSQEKSGLYYVFGDGVHTYTEIRDGQSSLESSHEYAVFDYAWIALINSKADLQYMNFELAKRQYISNLVNEITEENEKSTTLYPSVKASVDYIKGIVDELRNDIDTESETRTDADFTLQTNINNEESARILADTTLQDNIDTEATTRETQDNTLATNITNEVTARTNADNIITQNLSAEITARENADTVLNTAITNEAATRLLNDTTLQNNIDAEVTARQNALSNLSDDLAAENTRAIDAEENLDNIKANKADVYTKIEIDAKLTSAMHFKGTKPTYNDLPSSGNTVGDVWNILDTGENYAWDGEDWDKLSETIDLSPYALTEDVDEKILAEKDRREDADTELGDAIAAEKTRAETVEASLESTKADKSDTYTKTEVDNKDQAIKDDIYGRIWSKPSNPSQGHLYTKITNSAGGYALIFNESDGGGSQVYDKTDDIISYVGTNLEEGTGADNGVNVQIYSKNKTTNEGVRFNVNNQKAYYLKGSSKTNTDGREVAVIENIPTKTSDLNNDSDYTTNTLLNTGLAGKIDKYDELPEINKNYANKIVQYTGETTEDYVNGYFYKCIENGDKPDSIEFTPKPGVSTIVSVTPEDFVAFITPWCEGRPFGPSDVTHGSIGIYSSSQYSMTIETDDDNFAHGVFTITELEAAGFSFNPKFGAQQGATYVCSIGQKDYAWEQTNVQPETDTSVLQAQIASLTQQIKDLKLTIPQEVFTADEVRTKTKQSGKVTLCEDVDLGTVSLVDGTFANNITSINLNGYTLSASPTGGRALLQLRGSSQYTFNGNGTVEDFADNSSCVWSRTANNVCTINGGTWIAHGHTETIYCQLGTININGGVFKTDAEDKRYVLNCLDTNFKAGTAKIIVKGGEFWDFDPSANPEGPDTSYVAEGYTVTSREEDGHTIYTVVKA